MRALSRLRTASTTADDVFFVTLAQARAGLSGRGNGATDQFIDGFVEVSGRAADGHLVGLRDVEHDVGDRPALAARRALPARLIEISQESQ